MLIPVYPYKIKITSAYTYTEYLTLVPRNGSESAEGDVPPFLCFCFFSPQLPPAQMALWIVVVHTAAGLCGRRILTAVQRVDNLRRAFEGCAAGG